jgi:ubiquinol-cytochrome c reductase cytochrome b subunit
MAVAFLGYVLPWGQMSLWGATVITNLFSAVPYFGHSLVLWVWGGYVVDTPTLGRFFSLHFLFPFVMVFLVIVHIFFLHEVGRRNPLGLGFGVDKIFFNPYFVLKDVMIFFLVLGWFFYFSFFLPFFFMDVENFVEAKYLATPLHIKPEWYFLPAYAVLRSVPKKLGGVVFLVLFVGIYFFIPFIWQNGKFFNVNGDGCFLFFFWIVCFLLLMLLGGLPVEFPYKRLSVLFTLLYFVFFLL